MQKAVKRVKAETNSRMAIQVFANSVLDSSNGMISQARSGALEFRAQSGPGLSQLMLATCLNSMAFAKVVDAQENSLALILAGKRYEVQTYVSLTGHMWAGNWFLANRRSWEALPAPIRDVVTRVVNESAKRRRAELARRVLATGLKLRGRAVGTKARSAFNESRELVISPPLEKR